MTDRLRKVLKGAKELNLKFNTVKCKTAVPEAIYIGHKLRQ